VRAVDEARGLPIEGAVSELGGAGFTRLEGPFACAAAAQELGRLIAACAWRSDPLNEGMPPLEVVGEFVIPPIGEKSTPAFQTFHIDFGFPLDPKSASDIAHYTFLHIPSDHCAAGALTRIMRLDSLFGQRPWASEGELEHRFASYGKSHGSWHGMHGYQEGILARVVDAAHGRPSLPSREQAPSVLCGHEFQSPEQERVFFQDHGLRLEDTEERVELRPGQLLILDNLAVTHGRLGRRKPGELCQMMLGYRALDPVRQRLLRARLLRAFQVRSDPGS
jgi:hypothetical protein